MQSLLLLQNLQQRAVKGMAHVYPMSTWEKTSDCKGLRAQNGPKSGGFLYIVYLNVYLA